MQTSLYSSFSTRCKKSILCPIGHSSLSRSSNSIQSTCHPDPLAPQNRLWRYLERICNRKWTINTHFAFIPSPSPPHLCMDCIDSPAIAVTVSDSSRSLLPTAWTAANPIVCSSRLTTGQWFIWKAENISLICSKSPIHQPSSPGWQLSFATYPRHSHTAADSTPTRRSDSADRPEVL